MFTWNKIFLVSLTDKTQKDIRLPQGIGAIVDSLNVMFEETPYFIVRPRYDHRRENSTNQLLAVQIKDVIEEKYPAQCHKLGRDDTQ